MGKIFVRPIEANQTHALRSTILRPNRPVSDSVYPGDDAPETRHFGAFCSEQIVGIASIYPQVWPHDANLKAWRLRGMAVDPAFQRRGIGAALVHEVLAHIKAQDGEMLWCNARVAALDFYLSLGFEIIGEEFEIPEVGPHFLMQHTFV